MGKITEEKLYELSDRGEITLCLIVAEERYFLDKALKTACAAIEGEIQRADAQSLDGDDAVEFLSTLSLAGSRLFCVYLTEKECDAARSKLLTKLGGFTSDGAVLFAAVQCENVNKLSKNLQALCEVFTENGYCVVMGKHNDARYRDIIMGRAKELGCEFPPETAGALVRRCSGDAYLMLAETEKLAAASGYTRITRELMEEMSPDESVAVSVFKIADAIMEKNSARALNILETLLEQRQDPIMITGGFMGIFLDAAKVRFSAPFGSDGSELLGYKSGDFRFTNAKNAARRLSASALKNITALIAQADIDYKSARIDSTVVLEKLVFDMLFEVGAIK